MAQTVCVLPPAEDRERLLAVVADCNRPLEHVRRAHIVLSSNRLPVQEVARRATVSRPAVWRWQARYAEQGFDDAGGRRYLIAAFRPRRFLSAGRRPADARQARHQARSPAREFVSIAPTG